jgi:hypothetical protein
MHATIDLRTHKLLRQEITEDPTTGGLIVTRWYRHIATKIFIRVTTEPT